MTFDYRRVMSGQRRDPLAILMRGGLWLASWPYRGVVTLRNRKYDTGKSEIHDCGVPVISVGNLTTGGTGKTPIVCFIARELRKRDVRVAIVSRGYGRGDRDENDEAMELHARLPDVPHVQNPDRVEAARVAVDELEAQVILMDDGFQHRRLKRDVDLVVVDATCPFGFGNVLPRGLLREPLSEFRRADLVLITRCDAAEESRLQEIETTIRRYQHTVTDRNSVTDRNTVPIVRSCHRPLGILKHPDQREDIASIKGQRVAVLSAIGNPSAFAETVRQCGATIVSEKHLPDHDDYDAQRMQSIRDWISGLPDIDAVVCTHKDLVKIQSDQIGGKPIAAITIELAIESNEEYVQQMLDAIVARVAHENSWD